RPATRSARSSTAPGTSSVRALTGSAISSATLVAFSASERGVGGRPQPVAAVRNKSFPGSAGGCYRVGNTRPADVSVRPSVEGSAMRRACQGSSSSGGASPRIFRPGVEALERRDLPSTSGERFLAAVYPALLGRELDPAGLAVWGSLLDGGLSPGRVVRSVENSPECGSRVVQGRHGALLGRGAAAAGLGGFTALLGSGGTAEQAAAALAGSAEYYAVRGGGSAGGFLTALYRDALGRPLDPAGAAGF